VVLAQQPEEATQRVAGVTDGEKDNIVH
jgi:hypothetical protein